MRRRIELGILFLCCAAAAQGREEYKRDFLKTAALPAGRNFRLESAFGGVTVHTHATPDATIHATITCSASDAAHARACADRVQIAVDESAGGVSVRTISPRDGNNTGESLRVDYDLIIPVAAPLDLRNRFGPVSVTGLKAASEINNSNGRVTLYDGRGEQRITNAFGDVEVRGNDGDVVISNGNGSVTVFDVTGGLNLTNRFGRVQVSGVGKALTIKCNNGAVDVQRVGGIASITNSFGTVTVTDAKSELTVENQNGEVNATGVVGGANLHTTFGRVRFSRIGKALTVRGQNTAVLGDTVGGSANVETSFGNVALRDVQGGARVTANNAEVRLNGVGGEAYAKTSFSGVNITDAAGPVTVEAQNASVTVEARRAPKCQPVTVTTAFGPIRVAVPSGLGYNVAAKTSFGRIHSEHEVALTGEVSKDALNGKIGGGGCELKLSDRNGAIEIVKPGLRM